MNLIKQFMSRAVQSQMSVAGEPVKIKRLKTKEEWNVTGVVSSRDGSLTAEVGGVEYAIASHVLIPVNELYTPQVGDRVEIDGQHYMMINTICSPNDAAYSCDLVAVQK